MSFVRTHRDIPRKHQQNQIRDKKKTTWKSINTSNTHLDYHSNRVTACTCGPKIRSKFLREMNLCIFNILWILKAATHLTCQLTPFGVPSGATPWSWAITPTVLQPASTHAEFNKSQGQVTSWRLCKQRQSPSFLLSSSSGIPATQRCLRYDKTYRGTNKVQNNTRKRTRFCGKRRILCSSLAVACFKSQVPTKTSSRFRFKSSALTL